MSLGSMPQNIGHKIPFAKSLTADTVMQEVNMKAPWSISLCLFSVCLARAQYDPTPAVAPQPGLPEPAGQATSVVTETPPELPHAVRHPIAVRVVGSNVKNLN